MDIVKKKKILVTMLKEENGSQVLYRVDQIKKERTLAVVSCLIRTSTH